MLSSRLMIWSVVLRPKSSGRPGGRVAEAAEELADLVIGLVAHARARFGDEDEALFGGEAAPGGFIGDDNLHVLAVLAEEAALGRGEDAEDGIFGAGHGDGFAEGPPVGEQRFPDLRADDADAGGAGLFLRRVDAAFGEFAGLEVKGIGAEADEHEVVGFKAGNPGGDESAGFRGDEKFERHVFHGTDIGLDIGGIFGQNGFSFQFFGRSRGVGIAVKAVHKNIIRTEFGKKCDNSLAQAAGDAADGDHGADADDDAENGERAAETVRPDGVDGHADVFAEFDVDTDGFHSALKASTGSIRAALRAG